MPPRDTETEKALIIRNKARQRFCKNAVIDLDDYNRTLKNTACKNERRHGSKWCQE